jgi:hypothetical protein
LVLSWSSWTNGFRLQSSESLGATNWATMTNEPETTGTNSQVVMQPPATARFYRLALQ